MPTPSQGGVVDLDARRRRTTRAVDDTALAPVRHLPAALLDALQGSWGTPEELGVDRPARVASL